jgi:hypothetical protein
MRFLSLDVIADSRRKYEVAGNPQPIHLELPIASQGDGASMPETFGVARKGVVMKKILATAAIFMVAIAASQALAARPQPAKAPKTLVVAMHDPGCHWFLVHGKYTKSHSVAGSVRLRNMDEKALKVASSHGSKLIPVGKSLVLKRGHYVVTMVDQASDDNHLKLTVH